MNHLVFVIDPANKAYALRQVAYYMYNSSNSLFTNMKFQFMTTVVSTEEEAKALKFEKDSEVVTLVYTGSVKFISYPLFRMMNVVVENMNKVGLTEGSFHMI